MNYVYMLRCADGTLYTGWTTDLQRRLGGAPTPERAPSTPDPAGRWRCAMWKPAVPGRRRCGGKRRSKRLPRQEKLLLAGQTGQLADR